MYKLYPYTVTHLISQPPFVVETELLESAEKLGGLVSSFSSIGAVSSEVGAYVTLAIAADPSGVMLKFSQILKMITRIRFVGIEFGLYLDKFLNQIAKIFDKSTESSSKSVESTTRILIGTNISRNEQQSFKQGSKGKFDAYNYPLLITNSNRFRNVLIYFISWSLKLSFLIVFTVMEQTRKVNVAVLKIIRIHRKIHFILFNTALLDLMFKGTRNILHSTIEKSGFYWVIAVLGVSLAIYDVVEISITSSKVINSMSRIKKSEVVNTPVKKNQVLDDSVNLPIKRREIENTPNVKQKQI